MADGDTALSSLRPEGGPVARRLRLQSLVLCGCVALLAVFWQQRWGTVPDTSWLITVSERVLGGERLYADLIEANPPFSVWMYMPAVAAADLLRMKPEPMVHAYTYLLCSLGLLLAALNARRAGFAENGGLLALLPVFFALMVIVPGNAFTQRDQVGAVLLAPLLVLTAWRIEADAQHQPSWKFAIPSGLFASVIVLVKPHYALLLIAPALYFAFAKRRLGVLFGPEYWCAVGMCIVYLAAVLWFHPEFVSKIMPLLSQTYLSVGEPYWILLQRYAAGYLLLLLLWYFIRPGLPLSPLAGVFALASVAAAAVMVYQGKGWPYHAYPAIAFGLAAVLCQAVRSPADSIREIGGARALLLAVTVAVNTLPFMPSQKPSAELLAEIREAVERPTVAMIGTDIAVGHPLVRMVGGYWISSYCSDWLGSYAHYLASIARAEGRPGADRLAAIASGYTAFKLSELEREVPELLLVQKDDELWRGYLAQDARFIRFFNDYRLLSEDRIIAAYQRNVSSVSRVSGSD